MALPGPGRRRRLALANLAKPVPRAADALRALTEPELVWAVLQTVNGQSPIDPTLMPGLLHRMGELSRVAQSEVLSNRQQEILRPVADGVPTKGIAAHLSISQATLTDELRHIHDQLGVDDRSHAVAEAYRRNLL